MQSREGNLSPPSVWVWSSVDTQTRLSGCLNLGPWGCSRTESGAVWNLLKGQSYRDLDFSLQGTKGLTKAYVHRDWKDSNPLSILFYSFIVRIVKPAALKVQVGYGQDQGRALGHPGLCPPCLWRERPTHVPKMEAVCLREVCVRFCQTTRRLISERHKCFKVECGRKLW